MADNSGPDLSKYILPIGLLAIAYAAYQDFFGDKGKTQNNVTVDTTTADGIAASLQQQQAAGVAATITAAQAAAVANTVYGLAINQESGYQDSIVWETINSVNNLTDLLLILQQFGTRNVATSSFSWCAQFGFDCTKISMNQLIVGTLDSYHVGEINSFLSGANINYQF